MSDVEFGANGVRLDLIEDEYQLNRETRRIDGELNFFVLFGFHGCLAMLAWIAVAYPDVSETPALQVGLAIGAVSFLIAGFVGFYMEEEKRRAPTESDRFEHITGFGAFVGLALLVVIFTAATLGQMNYPNFVVPEELGVAAIFALAIGFVLVALVPRILDATFLGSVVRTLRWLTLPLNPIGRMISAVDAWLVYSVAPSAGCTLRSTPLRYIVLTLHLVSATVLAWVCPPPFGLVGTLWAIIAAVALARRWAWVETEREKNLADPTLPQTQLRVSTEMDLRDEALWALILLVIVLPVGIRQFYLSSGVPTSFALNGSVRDDVLAWFGFFGVELLKALPFVDWADIYGAHGLTRITTNGPLALHAVFVARVLIDLVFIGALIQAITISIRLSRHKRRFLQNTDTHVLDERIEKSELSRLSRRHKGSWVYKTEIKQYVHYDSHRLSRLRMATKKGTRLHATLLKLFELKGLAYAPPGERLAELARDAKIDRGAMEPTLKLLEAQEHLDLDYLAASRSLLNGKGEIEDIRQRVVQLMIKLPPSKDRDTELLGVLHGPATDSLAAIRILAAQALSRVARDNAEIIEALYHTAAHDRAGPVRKRVSALIRSRNLVLSGTSGRKPKAA